MRQIILDTETTGLDPAQGHRVIEIGALELVNRRLTGRSFHYYLQPDRDIEAGAESVHGISSAFLQDKPRFAEIAAEFLAFVDQAELVIHNAVFDVGFLDAELARLGELPLGTRCRILDTLLIARQKHPGQKNNLDALAKRYHVEGRADQYHGAVLDCEILAQVYLAMTGGQVGLQWASSEATESGQNAAGEAVRRFVSPRPRLPVIPPDAEALAAHEQQLLMIDRASGGKTLFRRDLL